GDKYVDIKTGKAPLLSCQFRRGQRPAAYRLHKGGSGLRGSQTSDEEQAAQVPVFALPRCLCASARDPPGLVG
ncbi:hypothetical protein, partial [uncultured Thiodictyon sp.]|uniref:hypothetical protein n=1 Tax=uncultured Thiodictyon sp. TaxID=1846217 RepID=UPI0025D17235